ncbi:hypothetical protein AVEN_8009-1 [Araneus ventricosus]|uniref:RING-type domain-containing protein n=1 Tax=Araneus ventricosus TaxID=182803 RepID=A0A4Y2KYM3_ARAVE|nr:hypothetical protein AVEN_8009-1 [Araneus ventricosus]
MQSGCVICYDSFDASSDAKYKKNDDEVRIVSTKCGHVFHNICIKKWLKRSYTCPECRRYVRKESLTKLFINFCIDNKSDNNAEESLDALKKQLCGKDLECVEKDKKIIGLQIDCAVYERKIEDKDNKIEELQTCFAHSELQILVKDGKIEELHTCFARSELESLEKDEKIKELQTNCALSELEILEKDGKIEELQTSFARSELESLEKDEKMKELQTYCARLELQILEKNGKIEELQTCFANSERDVEKMLQQQMKLNNEISAMKQEVKRLSCVEAENQKLLQEKNTLLSEKNILVSEREHLNTVNTIVERCPIDVKRILADLQVHVYREKEKGTTRRIAKYCSLLKQELAHSKENKTHLQNELIKVKQELAHSEEEKSQVLIGLKLVKHRMRTHQSDSRKRIRQLRERIIQLRERIRQVRQLREKFKKFKDLNSSSMSLSCGPSLVPVMSSLPNNRSLQCNNLAKSTLVCSPSFGSSSDCKNQVTPITVDFSENKRHKISIFDFVKKYSLVSTQSPETPVLRLANNALSAR